MTTCTPLKPFRCWQYRKDSGEAVPEWAGWTIDEMVEWGIQDGSWWVSLFDMCDLITPAEFAERFSIVEGT
jgi:hypothetical protein